MMFLDRATTAAEPTVKAASRKKPRLLKSASAERAFIGGKSASEPRATYRGLREKVQARREHGKDHGAGISALTALSLLVALWPGVVTAEPTLVAAAGAAVQVGGGPADASAEVGAALEAGLALDLGARLRLSFSGAYLPDVARPDRVARGLWRLGPALRLFLVGPSGDAGPWVALGGGMGATTDAARPYARADLGWSLGHAAQLGLVATALRELDSLDRGATIVSLSLRFDGVLPGPWAPRPAPVVAAARPVPARDPEPPLPAGTPLDPETVRTRIRDKRDDVQTCVALANRHGEPPPPRVDLALVILPAGRVHAARVHGGGDDLARCLETRARTWTFPTAEGTTRFAAPFVLQ